MEYIVIWYVRLAGVIPGDFFQVHIPLWLLGHMLSKSAISVKLMYKSS